MFANLWASRSKFCFVSLSVLRTEVQKVSSRNPGNSTGHWAILARISLLLSRLATSNFQAGAYFRQQCNLLQKFLVCANGTWCFLLSSSPLFSAEYGRTFFTILPPFLYAALALSFICLGNIERGVFFLVSTVFLQFELFASYSHYFSFPATFVLIIFARCSVGFSALAFDARVTSLHCPAANVSGAFKRIGHYCDSTLCACASREEFSTWICELCTVFYECT